MTTAATLDDPQLRSFLADVDRHMLELVDAHEGPVAAAARGPIAAGGKRLRPLLVRAARPRALEGDDAGRMSFDTCSLRAGAAVELIHTATLVHDDLLDGAALRRGEPTVGATSGRDVAIAAGDLLFSLAFDTLVGCRNATDERRVLRATRVLARASRTLAEGEALQARQARDPHLAEVGYLDRCAMKTGILFEAALQLGAILGGAELEDIDTLARFGRLVGTAFQVADDVLDCGSPETEALLGKRPGADLRDGTMTLPMLRAVVRDDSLAARIAGPDIADADVEPLLADIRATGAVDSAADFALAMRRDAEALLPELGNRFDIGPLRTIAAASVDRLS
ncbi:MAG: Trans-hexaprenyltranstransferase [Thermoleophilia bacterium]|nr:Trans-hexaprenyltranstransferase [Thermoleophilia bacterium]